MSSMRNENDVIPVAIPDVQVHSLLPRPAGKHQSECLLK